LSEVNQAIPDFYCHSILVTKDGFLIYGFEIDSRCDGCDSYLDIVKLSSDLNIEWKKKINLGDIHFNPNDLVIKFFLQEYEDIYELFYGNKMFSITKSGNVNTRIFFEIMNFQIISVCSSGENTIWLESISRFILLMI